MSLIPPSLPLDGATLHYHNYKPLGEGEFSKIFPCTLKKDGNQDRGVAVKCVLINSADEERPMQEKLDIWKEIAPHPNVMELLFSSMKSPESSGHSCVCYMVMEKMETDLGRLIYPDEDFGRKCTYGMVLEIMKAISTGLKHLHEQQIIHFNLKPEKVLISGKKVALTGLGKSWKAVPPSASSVADGFQGTVDYMAPEVFANTGSMKPTHSADIFSLGVLMYEILNRTTIHKERKFKREVGRMITWGSLGGPYEVWCEAPEVLCELVGSCLRFDGTTDQQSDHGRPCIQSVLDALELMDGAEWLNDPIPSYFQAVSIKRSIGEYEQLKNDYDDLLEKHERLESKYEELNREYNKLQGEHPVKRTTNPDCFDVSKPFELELGETVTYTGEKEIASNEKTGIRTDVLPATVTIFSGEEKRAVIKHAVTKDERKAAELKFEIEILRELPKHENVVHFYGGRVVRPCDSDDAYHVCVVMERMDCTLAKHVLDEKFKMEATFRRLLNIFISLCKGLQFVHDNKVLHHDMKFENVLVSDGDVVKIADFGVSKKMVRDPCTATVSFRGSLGYMAPESFYLGSNVHVGGRNSSVRVNHAVDVYSLGRIFWECLNFCSFSKLQPLKQDEQRKCEQDGNKSFMIDGKVPSCLEDLIAQCLRPYTKDDISCGRPTAQEVYDKLEEMLSSDWVDRKVYERPTKHTC